MGAPRPLDTGLDKLGGWRVGHGLTLWEGRCGGGGLWVACRTLGSQQGQRDSCEALWHTLDVALGHQGLASLRKPRAALAATGQRLVLVLRARMVR